MPTEIRFATAEAADEFQTAAEGIWEVYRDDRDPRLADMSLLCDAIEAALWKPTTGELVAIVPDRVRELAEIVAENCIELDESVAPDDIAFKTLA